LVAPVYAIIGQGCATAGFRDGSVRIDRHLESHRSTPDQFAGHVKVETAFQIGSKDYRCVVRIDQWHIVGVHFSDEVVVMNHAQTRLDLQTGQIQRVGGDSPV